MKEVMNKLVVDGNKQVGTVNETMGTPNNSIN